MAPVLPATLPEAESPGAVTTITTILFDLDDTLFDHLATARAALATTCAEQPVLHAADLTALSGHYAELLEEIHPLLLAGRYTVDEARQVRFERLLAPYGLGAAEAGEVAARHYGHYQRLRREVDGALALLRALKPRYQVGIITNNRRSEQLTKLRDLQLLPLVDALVTSEEVGVAKPDPRIFHEALTRLGATPPQAVMVGDNWVADVEGALAVGIRPVWLNRGGGPAPRPGVQQLVALEPLPAVLAVLTDRGRAELVGACEGG